MATKYDDIIKLRGGKAAYDIAEEKRGEWVSFIPMSNSTMCCAQ